MKRKLLLFGPAGVAADAAAKRRAAKKAGESEDSYRFTGAYLGGHPDALGPKRRVRVTIDADGLQCAEPAFAIAAASILSARAESAAAGPDYKFSPTAGVFGGMKAKNPSAFKQIGQRALVVEFRDEHGLAHEARFGSVVAVGGRPLKERLADMAAQDLDGAQKLAHYLMSIRTGAA